MKHPTQIPLTLTRQELDQLLEALDERGRGRGVRHGLLTSPPFAERILAKNIRWRNPQFSTDVFHRLKRRRAPEIFQVVRRRLGKAEFSSESGIGQVSPLLPEKVRELFVQDAWHASESRTSIVLS